VTATLCLRSQDSASCTPALEAGDARSTASIKRVAGSTLSVPVCCLFIRNDSETTEIDGLHQRRLRWVGVKWRTQQLVLLQRDVGEVASVRRVVGNGTVGGVTGALRGSGPHLDRGCNVSIIPGVHDGHLGSIRRLAERYGGRAARPQTRRRCDCLAFACVRPDRRPSIAEDRRQMAPRRWRTCAQLPQ
jgi:hypothetical protein